MRGHNFLCSSFQTKGHPEISYLGLLIVLHGQGEGVEHDGGEDGVLASGRGCEGPQLVLDWVLRDVTSDWLRVQRKLDAVSLSVGNN